MGKQLEFDTIGYWSEVKLDIVKKYATAYSKILAKQSRLRHVYIDGFAGAGEHVSKTTGEPGVSEFLCKLTSGGQTSFEQNVELN